MGGGRHSWVTMKGTRETATTTMKVMWSKKRRGRETATGCDIMSASNEREVGVSGVKAAGYDKLMGSRVEGRVLSRRVEGVMNSLLDKLDLDSKAPPRVAWDLMWENRGPGVWALDYREQYNLKGSDWRFDAVPKIMYRMNVSNYVDLDIELKLRELEEEGAHQLANMEAAYMGGGGVMIATSTKRRRRDVQDIRERKRTMRKLGRKK